MDNHSDDNPQAAQAPALPAGGVLMPTLYERLKAEGLAPPDAVKMIGKRKLTEAEVEYGMALEGDLKRATEDARICTWLITLGAIDAEDYERRWGPYDKMGHAMVYFWKCDVIAHFVRQAILAFKQGAD